MILVRYLFLDLRFESNVESYRSKTLLSARMANALFESNVESYRSKTEKLRKWFDNLFESNVESYRSKTNTSAVVKGL